MTRIDPAPRSIQGPTEPQRPSAPTRPGSAQFGEILDAVRAQATEGAEGTGGSAAAQLMRLWLAGTGMNTETALEAGTGSAQASDWVSLLLRASALSAHAAVQRGGQALLPAVQPSQALVSVSSSPASGPAAGPYASAGASVPARVGTAADRFRALQPMFEAAHQATGVPWQIQAAQWALETGWGDATPKDMETGRESFNLFGIKGEGPAGSVRAATTEFVRGRPVREVAAFRAYDSYAESILDHARLLTTPHYAPLKSAGADLKRWTDLLGPQHLGYATDPEYSRKLWQIIRENGWDR